MKNKIKYSLMLIVEIVAWIFFIKLGLDDRSFYLIVIIWSFFIGRHFTMYTDLMKNLGELV